MRLLANVTCVSIGGRGLLMEGRPGSGKSSLALALIDRGAELVGDDGILLERRGELLLAHPPPNIRGKLEIRGIGIVDFAPRSAPLALVLRLDHTADRLPVPVAVLVEGVALPRLLFRADDATAALRAEWAMRMHGALVGM